MQRKSSELGLSPETGAAPGLWRGFMKSLWVLLFMPALVQAMELRFQRLDHAAFNVQATRLEWHADGQADLRLQGLTLGKRELPELHLHCRRLTLDTERLQCRQGALQLEKTPLAHMDFSWQIKTQQLELHLRGLALAGLRGYLPELSLWQPQGELAIDGWVGRQALDLTLAVDQLAFASASGQQAGEGIAARLHLAAQRRGPGWHWQAWLNWPQGELYIAPWYRKANMELQAQGQVQDQLWQVEQAQLDLSGLGRVHAAASWQPALGRQASGRLLAAQVSSDTLDLAAVVQQLIQPLLDQQAGPKLTLEGQGRLALQMDVRGVSEIEVDLAADRLAAGIFSLSGVQAHIPWRRDSVTQATMSATAGQLGALPLGGFKLPLRMHDQAFTVDELAIPVLDGRLLLENFRAEQMQGPRQPGSSAWRWQLAAALEPVSMPLLAQALAWPRMSGVLSATLPRVHYADNTLMLDGQLMVAVFDGYLAVDGLRLLEPLGKLPRLQANVSARHLDLGMLTETFSFGDITGYIDADIQDLETAGVRPLAFGASIRSSPGDYPRRISQRAVQNISSLGGAGAGAAIQRSFLRIFETFGYRQLGLHCRLVSDVCLMAGIEVNRNPLEALAARLRMPGQQDDSGYVLIQGGGLPALNVIGYNQRVDWPELVTRLQAVVAGNGRIEVR